MQSCTEREHLIRIQLTDGGTRLFFQAGAYELMRLAADKYYGNYPAKSYSCIKVVDSDLAQNSPMQRYKLSNAKNEALIYTANLYHTKCSMLVNGKDKERFRQIDLPKIAKIAQSLQTEHLELNPVLLNNSIKRALGLINKARDNNCEPVATNPNKAKRPAIGTQLQHPQLALEQSQPPPYIEEDTGNPEDCPICDLATSDSQAIECSQCLSWLYIACTDMSTTEYEQHCVNDTETTFACVLCTLENEPFPTNPTPLMDPPLTPPSGPVPPAPGSCQASAAYGETADTASPKGAVIATAAPPRKPPSTGGPGSSYEAPALRMTAPNTSNNEERERRVPQSTSADTDRTVRFPAVDFRYHARGQTQTLPDHRIHMARPLLTNGGRPPTPPAVERRPPRPDLMPLPPGFANQLGRPDPVLQASLTPRNREDRAFRPLPGRSPVRRIPEEQVHTPPPGSFPERTQVRKGKGETAKTKDLDAKLEEVRGYMDRETARDQYIYSLESKINEMSKSVRILTNVGDGLRSDTPHEGQPSQATHSRTHPAPACPPCQTPDYSREIMERSTI